MGKKVNLIGKRFGRLVVLKDAGHGKHGKILWECICDCGIIIVVKSDSLNNDHTKSCGCLRREKLIESNKQRAMNLIGQRFGRLFVLKKVFGAKILSWLCLCTCGNYVVVRSGNLNNGSTKSCGCLQREIAIARNKQPVSLETRRKMSVSKKGKYCGKNSHMFGKPVSIETRQRMSMVRIQRGIAKGKNNPAWKGGISRKFYCQKWTKELKELIKKRDGYRCMNPCCKSKNPSDLTVHHIDYNKKNCDLSNLITVSRGCNTGANVDREFHETWYKAIMYRRYGYTYGL